MSQYTIDEGLKSSHFFIKSHGENIYALGFSTIDQEQLDFNNDYLQENVFEMVVVKLTDTKEAYCKQVAQEIKAHFDKMLEGEPDTIIYVNVKEGSPKHKLIERFMENDTNSHFMWIKFEVNGNIYLFYLNNDKTNNFFTVVCLSSFFMDEYGVEL